MELRQLQHLIAVAEQGNLTRAAAHLNLSQQALSASIRQLETNLGIQLLERGPRRAVLTPFGATLLAHARTIDAEMRQIDKHITDRLRSARMISIGLGVNIAGTLLARAIMRVLGEQPRLRAEVVTAPMDDLATRLLRGELDLIVGADADAPLDPLLASEVFTYDHYVAAAGARHPLLQKGALTLADLLEYPWVFAAPSGTIGAIVRKDFRRAALPLPKPAVQTASIDFAKAVLRASDHIAVLPLHLVEAEEKLGLLGRLGVPNAHWRRPILFAYRRAAAPSATLTALITALRTVASEPAAARPS